MKLKRTKRSANEIIRAHYNLHRRVTDSEVKDELRNLKRRHAAGTLDNNYDHLYSALAIAGYLP